ncbi:MAG: NAD(P)-dependent alcohol dehydrogenase [Burkholderiaceae bacterium]|nr:NAD(P)-dependent alcohol dehydrogenase [Burkholderiaceae bacterium]
MSNTKAYAALAAKTPLVPYRILRRPPGPGEVQLEILYCGICHSDLHSVHDDWEATRFPSVPGHEIIGRVSALGEGVTKFAVGDVAGIGCIIGCCGECISCKEELEQYCEQGFLGTFNSPINDTEHTLGGYSERIVVPARYALHVRHPTGQLAGAAPLLCAGITVYSPLRMWGVGPGKKIGVVGMGGLGHMAVKFASALGAEVVLFTSSTEKMADAKRFGATECCLSTDKESMTRYANQLDFVLNTVSASHNLDTYLRLLKRDGTQVLVGAPAEPHTGPRVFNLLFRRRRIAGSLIGSIRETQEMLDFSATHGITAEIELIKIADINDAFARMERNEVHYRFVIDMESLRQDQTA